MKVRRIWMCAGLLLALCGCARREEAIFAQEAGEIAGAVSGAAGTGGADGAAFSGTTRVGGTDGTTVSGADGTTVSVAAGIGGTDSTTVSGADGTTVSGAAGVDGTGGTAQETEMRAIVVDICGAVQNPGVYELKEGDRVCDAVQAAGGLAEDADLDSLNQAAILQDAEKIIVYTAQEVQQMREAGRMPGAGAAQFDGQTQSVGQDAADARVNINLADESELCTLSGIGEARARDIIAYREANGGFASVEEIMNVSGIKDATFNRIKDEITVQ